MLERDKVYDLAGYLGRVQEQLTMAALLAGVAMLPPARAEAQGHFKKAAEHAGRVQSELLEMIERAREEEAAVNLRYQRAHEEAVRRLNGEAEGSQWSPEVQASLDRDAPPLEPNRIKRTLGDAVGCEEDEGD